MWLSTASEYRRSLPIRETSTCIGTFPLRNPGTFVLAARSEAACSTACWTSWLGTSTVRRTLFSGSSSTRSGHGGIVAVGTWATAEGISAGGGT